MDNQVNEKGFNFTYSAKEQEEVKRIREKYIPREENKMEQLRRLDRQVSQKGTIVSILIGTIGTLILGVGLACTLEWQGTWFVPGIVIGVLGIAIMATSYPIYNHLTQKEREKIAPEILRLTEELMK